MDLVVLIGGKEEGVEMIELEVAVAYLEANNMAFLRERGK